MAGGKANRTAKAQHDRARIACHEANRRSQGYGNLYRHCTYAPHHESQVNLFAKACALCRCLSSIFDGVALCLVALYVWVWCEAPMKSGQNGETYWFNYTT